ncbi:type II toxin-antitoxin system RelE/ParE family toxin [Actinomyces trachealis]|uniref:type II toxin-antitoxin system RelE/ParE family toxin n=1 Tax=Actinomyces trachealis TaxID=2763540 RepID=UPI001892CAEA|nr:type II toxin-antitoxin system RelE/ParE family toxin [Actinomyces trachealis]
MEVRYADRKVEKVCIDERQMKRALDATVAKKLRLRIAELYNVESFADLLRGTGRWEQLTGDRAGQWSARLSANWRLIVTDEGGTPVVACVVEIVDYH